VTVLYLIRHGETDWNKEGKYTGQTDIPLNEIGRQQVREAAKALKIHNPKVIYTSDLIRAVETAQLIAKELHIPIIQDKRLREINQGEWEGLHISEIHSRYGNQFISHRDNPLIVSAPNGESIAEVKTRVIDFLNEITVKHPSEQIVISSHGLVLGIIRTIAMDIPINKVFEFIPENAKVYQMEIQANNERTS